MRHYPIFLDLLGRRVVVSGAGDAAVAKLRLLMKTEAKVEVFGVEPLHQIREWADAGKLILFERAVQADDIQGARLVYCANEDNVEDARVRALGDAVSVLTNVVDNLEASEFITPSIVDRDPVTVAIGTEGAAPVLGRAIKSRIEAMLPTSLGRLAQIGRAFRGRAGMLPMGRIRRSFWSAFYFDRGPIALSKSGEKGAEAELYGLLGEHLSGPVEEGSVALVGAGPGDPDLLTRKAAKFLHEADVVIHDRLVSQEVLELARREAIVIEAGKTGFGESWSQADINGEMINHAQAGHMVVRLKGGDPVIFGRLQEEIDALKAASIRFEVVPGITTASAAAASLDLSLTARQRNSSLRFLTAHDLNGFAEADWRALSKPGAVSAIYMGKRAARFLQGRLLMHGCAPDTAITAIENVSRADQRTIATTITELPDAVKQADAAGPVLLLLGLAPDATGFAAAPDLIEGVL